MNVKVEKLEKNLANITVELDAELVEKAITKAYIKVKNQVSMPGFRKGKVPQKMIERQYGVEVFYEDASDFLIQDSYEEAYDEAIKEIEIVSQPKIEDITIKRGENFVYVAQVAVKPVVTLGEYKGIEYTAADITVTEEEVNEEIEKTREQNSRSFPITDRPAKEGDICDIDFDGFVDGKEFQGGKAEGYIITLGSHTFVGTFEDQIIGHSIGDEFDVNVTFPEDYAEELKGKDALFKVKLNEIKTRELPELDDEFASEVSEFDTLAEYKAEIEKNIKERKTLENKSVAEKEILKKIVENSQMDIPDLMLDAQVEQSTRDFANRMESNGITIDQYLNLVGQTPEQFLAEIRPVALNQIKERLTLEAIAKAENIEVTDEMVEEELNKMAEVYKMDFDKFKEFLTDKERDGMKNDIAVGKAADFIFENGVAVEAKPEEEKAKEKKTRAKKTKEEKPEEGEQKAPAKRGRKKKVETEADAAEKAETDATAKAEGEEKKAPAKRGRKKKVETEADAAEKAEAKPEE